MESQPTNYSVWLRERLATRRQRNASYSLRTFAKALDLSPSTLSALMNGKRSLTLSAALKIADREGLSPDERRTFLSGLIGGRGEATRDDLRRAGAVPGDSAYVELDLDSYRLISDWYHFAILSLGKLPGARLDPTWIAGRLGITSREADDAVRRLRRLKLLKRVGTGFRQCGSPLTTPAGVSSSAIRSSHRQLLAKAEAALDEVPVERRDFGAVVMAIDPSRIAEARELTKRFRRDLSRLLEEGSPTSVYACTVQIFPLTKE